MAPLGHHHAHNPKTKRPHLRWVVFSIRRSITAAASRYNNGTGQGLNGVLCMQLHLKHDPYDRNDADRRPKMLSNTD